MVWPELLAAALGGALRANDAGLVEKRRVAIVDEAVEGAAVGWRRKNPRSEKSDAIVRSLEDFERWILSRPSEIFTQQPFQHFNCLHP